MIIHDVYKSSDGKQYQVRYVDADSFAHVPIAKIKQAYGVCFYQGKIVIGKRRKNNAWGIIGGSVEPGETPEQTLSREVREESNMKVIKSIPIGYQAVTAADAKMFIQLRYACSVEPAGEFVSDPDGSIIEIKLIDPLSYKQYFDWGKIGDRIISRALELKNHLYDT